MILEEINRVITAPYFSRDDYEITFTDECFLSIETLHSFRYLVHDRIITQLQNRIFNKGASMIISAAVWND